MCRSRAWSCRKTMAAFEKVSLDCIESVAEFEKIERDDQPLRTVDFIKVDPSEVEPWKGIMLRNSPGQAPAGVPVFIAQGTADATVHPDITKRGCAVERPGVTHTFAARDSANAALNWMTERFRGAPAPSSCER
jgi:hypothetical protein